MSTTTQRQHWLAVLAKADPADLAALWAEHGAEALITELRPAEIGLVMLRGRMGGTGDRFNLGETTVTRCAVRGPAGAIGHGYVRGRDKRHARHVAGFDALLQDEDRREALEARVIEPLAAAQAEARAATARKAAATRVDFFTLVRGEG